MNRALTEIEQNVIDSVVKLMLDNLTETWKPVANMEFRIQGRETRPQMLQVTGPTEIVILLVFDIRIADTRGMVNLCIPAAAIEAVGEAFAQGWQRSTRRAVSQRGDGPGHRNRNVRPIAWLRRFLWRGAGDRMGIVFRAGFGDLDGQYDLFGRQRRGHRDRQQ